MLKSDNPTASYSTFEEFLQSGLCSNASEAEALWAYYRQRELPSMYTLEKFQTDLKNKGIDLAPEISKAMWEKESQYRSQTPTSDNSTIVARWLNKLARLTLRLSSYDSAVLFIGGALILLLLFFPPTYLQYDKITSFRGFQFVFYLKDRIDGLVLIALCVAIGIATLLTYVGLNRIRHSADQSDGSEKN